jgi:hypothetical protein
VTIRRGSEWGTPIERPVDLVVAGSDAELASLVASGTDDACLGVSGGDLHRSLGAPLQRHDMRRLPVDVLHVELDGRPILAVAHVVARRGWWRGPLLAAVNCDHIGTWNVAPRAHPNDGRFDVVEVDASMSIRSRLEARRRLPNGTHVPHPDISVSTADHRSWSFARPMRVWIDGIDCGRCRQLSVAIGPDHFTICV